MIGLKLVSSLIQSGLPRSSLQAIFATAARQKTAIAFSLTLTGWSLMWAQALAIIQIVPQLLCVTLFFGGIALIPVCGLRSPSQRHEDFANAASPSAGPPHRP